MSYRAVTTVDGRSMAQKWLTRYTRPGAAVALCYGRPRLTMRQQPEEFRPLGDPQALAIESLKALAGLPAIGRLLMAARSLSGLHVNEIAARSMLGPATIRRAEASRTTLTPANLDRLIRAYAEMGVCFFVDTNDRRGVTISAAGRSKHPGSTETVPDPVESRPKRRAPRIPRTRK